MCMYASCRSVSVNPRRQKTASVTKFAQTAQHVAYEFIWIRRTCDYIPLNVHYYVLFGTMAKVGLELIRFNAWSVSRYAHVFVRL